MKSHGPFLLALGLSGCTELDKFDKLDALDTDSCIPCDTDEPESPEEDTDEDTGETSGAPDKETEGPDGTPIECFLLDFDSDADGNAIHAGQDIAEVYAGWGFHIATWDASRVYEGLGIAFDSSAPPGTDYDLGTPNEMYGGPGTGAGGESNDTALYNLLIRAESTTDADGDGLVDVPDDHVYGATFVITLDSPLCLESMDFVDIDESEASGVMLSSHGGTLASLAASQLGDNSRETIEPGICSVTTLEFSLTGSGALDRLYFCEDPTPCEATTLYGVQDHGEADSQFFVLDLDSGEETALGPIHPAYDIESLEVEEGTGRMLAIAGGDGVHDGEIYEVDKETGALTLLSTADGRPEITAIAFHPDGSLWAFKERTGLLTVDPSTGAIEEVWDASSQGIADNWEGLAWDPDGTYLYGSDEEELYRYDPVTGTAEQVCCDDLLPRHAEAMDFDPNGVLYVGLHKPASDGLDIVEVDIESCTTSNSGWDLEAEDIEGIAFEVCE